MSYGLWIEHGTISQWTLNCPDSRIPYVSVTSKETFGKNLRRLREALGLSQEELAEKSEFDRSYVGGIERGERNPSISAIFRLASALSIEPYQLFLESNEEFRASTGAAGVSVSESKNGLAVKFRYDQFDAEFEILEASKAEYDEVLSVLRKGLATKNNKANAVAEAYLVATAKWPDANPSDLWTFLLNRLYCDRSAHPASSARLNLEQSWKRTSGWALERVLESHYGPFLKDKGVTVEISNKTRKASLLEPIEDSRVVPDKADVLITYKRAEEEKLMGVIHVKASLAERRTDDVPMSQALIAAGYLSIFWTMDCKSYPAEKPTNNGELGEVGEDEASDKRQDFEDHGYFSACFSYNSNTVPTSEDSESPSKIIVCNFKSPDDHFAKFLIDAMNARLAQ